MITAGHCRRAQRTLMDAEVDGMDIGSPQIERRTAAGWTAFHWMHVLLAVAAIALYVLGGIAQSRIGALPDDFPIDDLAYPAWHARPDRASVGASMCAGPTRRPAQYSRRAWIRFGRTRTFTTWSRG